MLLLAQAALACGGFFPPPKETAISNTQEVIFEPGDGEVAVEYRVLAAGDATRFGWVIPIAGEYRSLADADGQRFRRLNEATAPQLDFEEVSSGCGMGASKNDLAGGGEFDTGGARGVDEVASGFTGTYAYTVLEATDSDALLAWLAKEGFDVGPSGPTFAQFVKEGGWQFVALSLEGAIEEGAVEAPPIRIVYSGDRMQYPGRVSLTSASANQHTIVYVVSDERARIQSGWTETPVDLVWEGGETEDYVTNSLWPERLAAIGEEQGYATVFAGEVEGAWVTRFETYAPSTVHTTDPVFTADAGTTELHLLLSNRTGCDAPAGAALLPLLVLWGQARRRREARDR